MAHLKDLLTEEAQQDIQKSFAFATGFGVVFTDTHGNHIGQGDNFCTFCNLINETAEGISCCARSNRNAIKQSLRTHEPCIYICHAGLVNIEIPLFCSGEYVGAITAGQILCSESNNYPVDEEVRIDDWLKNEKLYRSYQEIQTMNCQQIEAVARALSTITNSIIQTRAYAQVKEELAKQTERLLKEENQRIHLEKQLQLAQFDALSKQVMPHFIFNVINSISRMLSLQEYDTARQMLNSFSQMMRYSLSNMKTSVALADELNYIENYLSIQKIRFGSRINYKIECNPKLQTLPIPFFSLQPLVENSINHGLLNCAEGGTLHIACTQVSGVITIMIKDNGAGISEKQLEVIRNYLNVDKTEQYAAHVGLYNCYKRLSLMYQSRLHFQIESEISKGTVVTITLCDKFA